MTQIASRFAQLTSEHVLAILQADLPADLRVRTQIGAYFPGLLSQLPCISVAAIAKQTRPVGLGGTVALKREIIDGAPVDLGYVTGETGACEFTLTLWGIVRPQVEELRAAIVALDWVRRARSWELPAGTLNRATFLRCHLQSASAAIVAPLPPAPPSITVNTNNTDLRTAPAPDAQVVGQANAEQTFELLGRSADAAWVQGCCFNGQAVWMAVSAVTTSIPMAMVPVLAAAPVAAPSRATRRRRRAEEAGRRSEIDTGTAILATATGPVRTAQRQDLQFAALLEVTQEPLATAGDRIQELHITRRLGMGDQVLDTERTRRRAASEEVVDEFP